MEISGWGWNAQYRSVALAAVIWRDGIKPLRLARNRHIAQLECGVHKINLASLPPEIMERIEDHTAEAIYRHVYVQEPFRGYHCKNFWAELGLWSVWHLKHKRYLRNNSIAQPAKGTFDSSFLQTFGAVETMHKWRSDHKSSCSPAVCCGDDYVWEDIAKLEENMRVTALSKRKSEYENDDEYALAHAICSLLSDFNLTYRQLSEGVMNRAGVVTRPAGGVVMLFLVNTTKSNFDTADEENIIQALSEPALYRLKKFIRLFRFERTIPVPTRLSKYGPIGELRWAELEL